MAYSTAGRTSNAKITLHWLEVSRSHRILWLLEELGVPYELATYKRQANKAADPKLKQVHPLGKSPVLTIEVPGRSEPLVLAESAHIVEYLCDHYDTEGRFVPTRYQTGNEGQVGGETEAWLRYRFYMHFSEGSMMPLNVISLLMSTIRNSPVWFFIKPITNGVAQTITDLYLKPNFKAQYQFLEDQLKTSPDGGGYLCGKTLSAADIMMSFPMEAGRSRSGLNKEQCPLVWEYVDRLHEHEGYKRSVRKIEEVEGSFKSNL